MIESNRSAEDIQGLINSGALDQIKEAQAGEGGTYEQLVLSSASNETIQNLINTGAIDQIREQDIAAINQLEAAGIEDRALQDIIQKGALDQIADQGFQDQELQKLVNSGAVDQITEQNLGAIDQILKTGMTEKTAKL